jgi:hypothetical protein
MQLGDFAIQILLMLIAFFSICCSWVSKNSYPREIGISISAFAASWVVYTLVDAWFTAAHQSPAVDLNSTMAWGLGGIAAIAVGAFVVGGLALLVSPKRKVETSEL